MSRPPAARPPRTARAGRSSDARGTSTRRHGDTTCSFPRRSEGSESQVQLKGGVRRRVGRSAGAAGSSRVPAPALSKPSRTSRASATFIASGLSSGTRATVAPSSPLSSIEPAFSPSGPWWNSSASSSRASRRARPTIPSRSSLIRGTLAPFADQALDLGLVDVGAHDLVADVREARARGEADVAGSDDGDSTHWCTPRSWRRRPSESR